jgi:hypothetical protein
VRRRRADPSARTQGAPVRFGGRSPSAALAGALVLGLSLGAGAFAAGTPAPPAAPVSPAPEEPPAAPAEVGAVRIEVETDRKTVTLGDPITVTVRLVHPPEVRVTSFEPERFLGDLTLLEHQAPQARTLPDGRLLEARILRVARYRMGAARVPSLEATFVDAAGKEGRVATVPLPLTVGSTLSEGDSRPADIKNPAIMAVRAIWPWILAAAAAMAVAAIWMWRRRARRARPAAAAPSASARPAHEVAYAELERLLSAGLLEAGRVKEFYIELAEILRRYVAARFGVDTFERTTAEILEALRLARLPTKGMALTSEFFGACDMVKFAKYVPPPDETRVTVERAYLLVDETRPREAPKAERGLSAAAGAAAGGGR